MKVQTKILVGFLLIIFLTFAQVTISLFMQAGILDKARQVQEVESPLEFMVKDIIIKDALLTGEARNAFIYAQNDDLDKFYESKAIYEILAVEMDYLLSRDIRILLRQSQRSEDFEHEAYAALDEIERINEDLVELEMQAFRAIEDGDFDTAYNLIAGNEYSDYKKELYDNYNKLSRVESEVTSSMRADIFRIARRLILVDFAIGLAVAFTVIVTLFVIRGFIPKLKDRYSKKK